MTLAERALALIRVPSVIGDEKAIADLVEAWAQTHYAREDIVRVSHSLVIGRRVDPRPTVALVGHLDTVPSHPDGNVPRIEGDRLYGLGASDMKGSLAVMMALAEALSRDTLPVNLLLVFYEREEGPFQESGLGPLFAAVPELSKLAFAIAMEPTDLAVQVGCVGSLHPRLEHPAEARVLARHPAIGDADGGDAAFDRDAGDLRAAELQLVEALEVEAGRRRRRVVGVKDPKEVRRAALAGGAAVEALGQRAVGHRTPSIKMSSLSS